MPDIIDTTNPHTLIVRWDDYNNVCEVQIMMLRHVEIDGEVVKHEVGPPEWLDHKHLDKLTVLKDATKNALAEVNRMKSELSKAYARIHELENPTPIEPEPVQVDDDHS